MRLQQVHQEQSVGSKSERQSRPADDWEEEDLEGRHDVAEHMAQGLTIGFLDEAELGFARASLHLC